MKTIDMKKLYSNKNYRGNWVALKSFVSDPEVLAYAKTLKQTIKKAEKKGFEHPVLMQIPKEILPIAGII